MGGGREWAEPPSRCAPAKSGPRGRAACSGWPVLRGSPPGLPGGSCFLRLTLQASCGAVTLVRGSASRVMQGGPSRVRSEFRRGRGDSQGPGCGLGDSIVT